jgi:ankyrin repeat protein
MCDSWDQNGSDIISSSLNGGVEGMIIGALVGIKMRAVILAQRKRAAERFPATEALLAITRSKRNVRRWLQICVIVIASAYFLEWKADFYSPPAPLVIAAEYGNSRAVAWLIRHGSDVNEEDGSGETALMKASKNGDWRTVKFLLKHGAKVNIKAKYLYTALHFAACHDDAHSRKCLDLLIAHGADVNAQTFEGAVTPLMEASDACSIKAVRTLVLKGANVNDMDVLGEDSLMRASSSGQYNVVKYLLSKGADVRGTDYYGKNALMFALANHKNDCAKLLISRGAKVKIKDDKGDTPLSLAKANPEMLSILKAAGAK